MTDTTEETTAETGFPPCSKPRIEIDHRRVLQLAQSVLTKQQFQIWRLFWWGDDLRPNYNYDALARKLSLSKSTISGALKEANPKVKVVVDAERALLEGCTMPEGITEQGPPPLSFKVTVAAGSEAWSAPDNTQKDAILGRR